jgi:hypothetical protein
MPDKDGELMMKPIMVQRQSISTGDSIPTELEASIDRIKGNGQPLPNKIRKPMEQAFGSDFSGVKVHTDTPSDQLNQSIRT